jgi:hypothetical protein
MMNRHDYRVRTSVNSLYHNTPFLEKIYSKYARKFLKKINIYGENTENEKCFPINSLESKVW